MTVITLSRQSGSEGNKITEILCQRLGWKYFDKNLMAELATSVGVVPNQVTDISVDSVPAKSFLERAFGNYEMPFGDPSGWTWSAQQDARAEMSVQQVRTLTQEAYRQGHVIIVGRGGMVSLAGKPDVLHVRVVAPVESRIQRWMDREGLNYETASAKVRERDQAHIDFVKRYFEADVTDPTLFDLVINTEKITPETAADMIIKALESLKVKA